MVFAKVTLKTPLFLHLRGTKEAVLEGGACRIQARVHPGITEIAVG